MNASNAQPTFEEARSQAHAALRAGRAATAERWLRALIAQAPRDVNCQWLLGIALLDQDQIEESVATLERVVSQAPDFANARVDLARAYRRAGRAAAARDEVRRVLEKVPQHHRAWLAYGDVLVELNQHSDACIAYERGRLTDPERQGIEEAAAALTANDRRKSEELFRAILQKDPGHVAALCGLAAVSLAADRPRDAERLLLHALRQSEYLPLAYRALASTLIALGRLKEADAATAYLAQIEPQSLQTWLTMANVATQRMRQEQALDAYQRALAIKPEEPRLHMSIGHVHKTLGRRSDSEAAYKQALRIDPGLAEAYWSLADLKNYAFSAAEMAAIEQLLISDKRDRTNEAQLHFALGKALEQRGSYPQAFVHYQQGNAARRLDAPFDSERFERRSARIRAFFDRAFFSARAGCGAPDQGPIFIVGLPRSGSTLIEQILASHSRVEGTMELPNILSIVGQFDDMRAGRDGYPETVGTLPAPQFAALGRRYLEETAPLHPEREHFTDKLPNNFSHVGLIHSILPGAIIIDARRHPLDACFSAFRQNFAEGQSFTYSLEDLGCYYRTYLSLMDHWDQVLPGKVLHIQYEALVGEPETHIRRLLAHCGLEFEPACLNFHATRRSVRTASAEQVRQPIYTSGVGYWRHFESQLEPLRRALGDALDRF